jgi:hypothetical protein
MKPLILTNAAGAPVRVNPMQLIGWAAAEVPIPDTSKVVLGSALGLPDGPRLVRESPENVDLLFQAATDGWMRPPLTRRDLERFMEDTRARAAEPDDGARWDDEPPPAPPVPQR